SRFLRYSFPSFEYKDQNTISKRTPTLYSTRDQL
ncbi:hypothetical protein T09_6476, partial [Trichinella sp. T9]